MPRKTAASKVKLETDDGAAAAAAARGGDAHTHNNTGVPMQNSDDVFDDDDEIVGTIPVFLSQSRADELFLLQYPLRPVGRPYDADLGRLASVRIKPEQKTVEMKYELDTASSNYDDESQYGDTRAMTMKSRLVSAKTNYAVASLHDGAVFLSPVAGQCR
jgi:hypothetical protein